MCEDQVDGPGLAILQSVASLLGNSTVPAATTVTFFHLSLVILRTPELTHIYPYPRHPEFSRVELNSGSGAWKEPIPK